MSTRINFSINMTKLKKLLIENPGLIGFKTKNGDACINCTAWINDEFDDYNNDVSIQLNPPKEVTLEKNIYLGNGKTAKAQDEIKRREQAAKSKLEYESPKRKDVDEAGQPIEEPTLGLGNDDLPF